MRALSSTLVLSGLLIVLSAGCSSGGDGLEPRQLLPVAGDPTFVLYVSNQSFEIDPVDIDVYLDDELAVEGDFLVEGQHSWHTFDFRLAPGAHELRAVSRAGTTEYVQTVELPEGDRYGVLNFWYYGEESSTEAYGPTFSFELLSEPPVFL